jgi:hypothetical protein
MKYRLFTTLILLLAATVANAQNLTTAFTLVTLAAPRCP